jgi:hypothetical protein
VTQLSPSQHSADESQPIADGVQEPPELLEPLMSQAAAFGSGSQPLGSCVALAAWSAQP